MLVPIFFRCSVLSALFSSLWRASDPGSCHSFCVIGSVLLFLFPSWCLLLPPLSGPQHWTIDCRICVVNSGRGDLCNASFSWCCWSFAIASWFSSYFPASYFPVPPHCSSSLRACSCCHKMMSSLGFFRLSLPCPAFVGSCACSSHCFSCSFSCLLFSFCSALIPVCSVTDYFSVFFLLPLHSCLSSVLLSAYLTSLSVHLLFVVCLFHCLIHYLLSVHICMYGCLPGCLPCLWSVSFSTFLFVCIHIPLPVYSSVWACLLSQSWDLSILPLLSTFLSIWLFLSTC